MKILLINPPYFSVSGEIPADYSYPSLGLAYVGAVLENSGHEVRLIDIDVEKISDNQFLDIIKEGYDIVGATASTSTFYAAEKLLKLVKLHTQSVTVLGGVHASIRPEKCLDSPHIDFVVRGEGELTMLNLVNAIRDRKDPSLIEGVSYRKNGGVVHNADRKMIDNLDTIPFPAIHLYGKFEYHYPQRLNTPTMPIVTSRGCPYKCTFCCTKLTFGRKIRMRSTMNVVDEIEERVKKYGVKEFHIWDDVFTLDKKRVLEMRDELRRRNLRLSFLLPNGARVDHVDEEILTALKEMGFFCMHLGVESGSQKVLDRMKKGITLEQTERAFALAKKVGFETNAFILIGHPGEDERTLEETLRFILKIDPDLIILHILKPFPGTEVYDYLLERGLITDFDYSKYSIYDCAVHRLPGLDEEALLEGQRRIYRKFYLRRGKTKKILIMTLRRFKNWQGLRAKYELAKRLIRGVIYVMPARGRVVKRMRRVQDSPAGPLRPEGS